MSARRSRTSSRAASSSSPTCSSSRGAPSRSSRIPTATCSRSERAASSGGVGGARPDTSLPAVHLEQLALIVDDYDEAIGFFVDALGFELVEDSPSLTNDGRPKRWVVVRPPGAATGLLLARADGDRQARAVGDQFAGRVGLFLRVDDFSAQYDRMREAGVEFVSEPREEAYGQVAVFLDVAGNRWDLLGPRA